MQGKDLENEIQTSGLFIYLFIFCQSIGSMIFIFRLPSKLNQKSGARCRSPEQQMNFLPRTENHFNEYRVWILIVSLHMHVLFCRVSLCYARTKKTPLGLLGK